MNHLSLLFRPIGVAIFGVMLLAACKKVPNYGPSETQIQADRRGKLRNEILTMAQPRGCEKTAECKALELGYNRCGGPRQFVVYCSKGVDLSALEEKAAELFKLEKSDAENQGEPPPCKKVNPPVVELADGSCRAR